MAKALKTAAFVVGGVALLATGAGALAGVGLLGAGITASSLALGTVSISAIASAAGLAAAGLSVAAGALAKKPTVSVSGNPEKFTANKDQGIPYAVGRTSVAGWLVHRQTFDHAGSKNNAFQSLFAVWSGGGPIKAIESFKVDDQAVSFDFDVANGAAYHDFMWLRTQLGNAPTDPGLQATGFYPYPDGWSASSKMSGYAGFAWTLKFDTKGKVYPSGVGKPTAILQGVLAYDPRQDSTYPGGTGPCRALDESTYVYSENPWIHALTWTIGRWQNGKRVLGIGMALAAIDVPAIVEAANIADVNGWKIGGVVYSTDGKYEVLKKMMAAGGGEPLRLGGMLSCTISTPRVPLATITTADIIGKASVTGCQGSRDRINGCIPSYRSEEHDWSLVPASLVRVDTFLAEDGAPRTASETWELVQDKDQVAELAAYKVCRSREFGPIVTPLKLKWAGYKPGDCLHIASPELGMDGQDILVTRRHFDPETGAVTLTSRSETSGFHAFALGKTGVAPPTPSLQVIDRGTLPVPGYDAVWSGVADDNGKRPEDNATFGAPGESPVGPITANELVQRVNDAVTTIGIIPPGATIATQLTAIEAFAGAGNLLGNTDFAGDRAGWSIVTDAPASFNWGRDLAGFTMHGEHYLGLICLEQNGDRSAALVSDWVTVTQDQWIQVSAWLASRECAASIRLQWGDGGGNYLRDGAESEQVFGPTGSENLDGWQRVWCKAQVPGDARFARLVLVKGPYLSNPSGYLSWAFLLRPMLAQASAGQTVPSAYRPGGAGAGLVTTRVRIEDVATAAASDTNAVGQRASLLEAQINGFADSGIKATISANAIAAADATGAVAQRTQYLESAVGGPGGLMARTGIVEGTLATVVGKLGAYMTLSAQAGSSSATIQIAASDNNGTPYSEIILDSDILTITGRTIALGGIDTSRIGLNQVTDTNVFFYNYGGWAVPQKNSWVNVDGFGFTAFTGVTTAEGGGQQVKIDLAMVMNRTGSDDDHVQLRVIRDDGTVLGQIWPFDVQGQNFSYVAYFYDGDPIPAHLNTYTVQISASDNVIVRQVFMCAALSKR